MSRRLHETRRERVGGGCARGRALVHGRARRGLSVDMAIVLPSQVVHRYRAHFDGPAAGCGHDVHRGDLVAKTPAG